jgi:hypothetical protein
MDEDQNKLYNLIDEVEKIIRLRGEIAFSEIAKMAYEKELRPSAVIDDISFSPEFKIDFVKSTISIAR